MRYKHDSLYQKTVDFCSYSVYIIIVLYKYKR